MTSDTDLREVIALLRDLDAKATPGPWAKSVYADQWGSGEMLLGNNGKGKYACHVYTDVRAATTLTTDKWQGERHASLSLIAALRSNLTALLAAAERSLTARNDALEEAAVFIKRTHTHNTLAADGLAAAIRALKEPT